MNSLSANATYNSLVNLDALMQTFSTWSEREAHVARWLLLGGWLLLILSLLVSPWATLDPWVGRLASCPSAQACALHDHDGNRIFWGVVVPAGLLIIVVFSHELWRRICPLSFVSQLFRALGLQRTIVTKSGRRDVAKVSSDSWLARHHLSLQWFLLIAGLVLRLLLVNSSPLGLGLFLTLTLVAALVVGWAYGGKAWCQFVCPMGPVQMILTGPRSLFGSAAHLGTKSKITQSMCRVVSESGAEKSACVACQSPCLDIDAERLYWQSLRGKRGLVWAWYSYPGLVLAFFLLIQWQGGGDVDYLRSGRWAYDATLHQRALSPLMQWSKTVAAPVLQPLHPAPQPPRLPPPEAGPVNPAPARGSGAPASRGPLVPSGGPGAVRTDPRRPVAGRPGRARAGAFPIEGQRLPHLPNDFKGGSRKPGSVF